jgi:hypothetical protein
MVEETQTHLRYNVFFHNVLKKWRGQVEAQHKEGHFTNFLIQRF